MKRAVKQILISAVALLVFCLLCRIVFFNEYELRVPLPKHESSMLSPEEIRFAPEQPGLFSTDDVQVKDGYMRVRITPLREGETFLDIQGRAGEYLSMQHLQIGLFNTVYDYNSGGFTGDSAVLIATSAFFLTISIIMLRSFRRARGSAFYSYTTIYFAGFSIFSTVTGIMLSYITVKHLADPLSYSMYYAYRVLCGASLQFMLLTLPLVTLFSFALAISNIVLLRHERTVLRNMLGIILSLVLLTGVALGLYLFIRPLSGSEEEVRRIELIQNVCATVFVYFECMLAGSVICALRAAYIQPEYDKDYIIILGCRFRPDGTLPPLLRGRVDRALAFWSKQRKLFSKEATFIPSGGQGPDERMSEAEAMRRYIVERGVREELVLPEEKSASTYENMLFSKHIIDGINSTAKVLFSTTNYHLFRSGVIANKAGLDAQGIGSKTRWWFWPNAFVREWISLLANRWKESAAVLLGLIAFFLLMAAVLP